MTLETFIIQKEYTLYHTKTILTNQMCGKKNRNNFLGVKLFFGQDHVNRDFVLSNFQSTFTLVASWTAKRSFLMQNRVITISSQVGYGDW